MKSVTVSIKFHGTQQTHSLPLLEMPEGLFVANPHADIPHQPALVKLDPTRLETLPEIPGTLNYKGLLLEIPFPSEA